MIPKALLRRKKGHGTGKREVIETIEEEGKKTFYICPGTPTPLPDLVIKIEKEK